MMKAEAAGSLPKTNAEAVRKKPGRKRYGWMKGLLLPAAIIAIWQVIGGLGVVSATVLPTPVTIVLTFKELILRRTVRPSANQHLSGGTWFFAWRGAWIDDRDFGRILQTDGAVS